MIWTTKGTLLITMALPASKRFSKYATTNSEAIIIKASKFKLRKKKKDVKRGKIRRISNSSILVKNRKFTNSKSIATISTCPST